MAHALLALSAHAPLSPACCPHLAMNAQGLPRAVSTSCSGRGTGSKGLPFTQWHQGGDANISTQV